MRVWRCADPWGMAQSEVEHGHSQLATLRRFLLLDGLIDLKRATRGKYEAYRRAVLRPSFFVRIRHLASQLILLAPLAAACLGPERRASHQQGCRPCWTRHLHAQLCLVRRSTADAWGSWLDSRPVVERRRWRGSKHRICAPCAAHPSSGMEKARPGDRLGTERRLPAPSSWRPIAAESVYRRQYPDNHHIMWSGP